MNKRRYKDLLCSITPRVIESLVDFEELVDEFQQLLLKEKEMGFSQEEKAALDLLQVLLEEYLGRAQRSLSRSSGFGRQGFLRELEMFIESLPPKQKPVTRLDECGYSVDIPEGNRDAAGNVALTHGQHYGIKLSNHTSLRCNAEIIINGKYQGAWRLPSQTSIVIERAAHDGERFTFYELDAKPDSSLNSFLYGLIQVTFTPEAACSYHESELKFGIGIPKRSICDSRIYNSASTERIDFSVSSPVVIGCRLIGLRKQPTKNPLFCRSELS